MLANKPVSPYQNLSSMATYALQSNGCAPPCTAAPGAAPGPDSLAFGWLAWALLACEGLGSIYAGLLAGTDRGGAPLDGRPRQSWAPPLGPVQLQQGGRYGDTWLEGGVGHAGGVSVGATTIRAAGGDTIANGSRNVLLVDAETGDRTRFTRSIGGTEEWKSVEVAGRGQQLGAADPGSELTVFVADGRILGTLPAAA